MKRNKKIWSFALAGALAVSNLSGVVSIPLTTLVAQAASSSMSVKLEGTEVTSANAEDTLALSATAEEGAKLKYFVSNDGKAWTEVADGTYKVKDADKGNTLQFGASDGVSATEPDADCIKSVYIHDYSFLLDDEEKQVVSKGKSYTLEFYDGAIDITNNTTLTLKSGPASISGNKLTVNDNAITNASIIVTVNHSGDAKSYSLTFKVNNESSAVEELKPVLDADSINVTSGDATGVIVLVDDKLPDGYEWKNSNPTYSAPTVVSGDMIVTAANDASGDNAFKITSDASLTEKSTVTLRYKVSGTAERAIEGAPAGYTEEVEFAGYVDQTVTVYPALKYKLAVTGDNYNTNTKTYTLNEEDGSITLTASVTPDGKDIPETDDVKYVWAAKDGSKNIKVTGNGATATITAADPFKVSNDQVVTLTVTKKDGSSAVPGIESTASEYKVALATTSKPTIEASETEVTTDDAVKFTVKDNSGKTITDLGTAYEIYDGSSKITVPEAGYKFTVGSHKITVKDTNRNVTSDPITITVRSEDGIAATGLKINKEEVEFESKDGAADETVKVTVLPDGTGSAEEKKAEINTVTVKSNDEKVATVVAGDPTDNVTTLKITPVGPGETTIDITADDKNVTQKKTIKVTVAGYKKIEISGDEEVEVGKTVVLNSDVQVYGKDTSKNIVWHSSDESVAVVEDGVVTGVAEGTASIYATLKLDDSKKSNEIEITVVDNTIPNAIAVAEQAAEKAAKDATADNIKAAQDAIAAAEEVGATDKDLETATGNLEKAIAAKDAADKEAAKKAEEEKKAQEEAAKKAAEEAAKKSDGSEAGKPAAAGTELKDATTGATTGYVVTNATAGAAEAQFKGSEAAKAAKSFTVPDTVKDSAGNEYKVTSIAANAFAGMDAKTVTIGKNIKKIDNKAFANSNVKKVNVKGTKLTKASKKAFNKLKKGSTIKVTGKNKKANKKLLNTLKNVKNGKIKVK